MAAFQEHRADSWKHNSPPSDLWVGTCKAISSEDSILLLSCRKALALMSGRTMGFTAKNQMVVDSAAKKAQGKMISIGCGIEYELGHHITAVQNISETTFGGLCAVVVATVLQGRD